MSEPTEKPKFPTPQEFMLLVPLYNEYHISEPVKKAAAELRYFEGTLDCFCVECGNVSVFSYKSDAKRNPYSMYEVPDGIFGMSFDCTRNGMHKLLFIFQVKNQQISKIGQTPSLADIQHYNIKRYSKSLGKEKFKEFTKAIGLSSHGVGVGSFVYLRRIFEALIEESHEKARRGQKIGMRMHT